MLSFLQRHHTESDDMIWHANEASCPVGATNLEATGACICQPNDDFYVGHRCNMSALSYHLFVLECRNIKKVGTAQA